MWEFGDCSTSWFAKHTLLTHPARSVMGWVLTVPRTAHHYSAGLWYTPCLGVVCSSWDLVSGQRSEPHEQTLWDRLRDRPSAEASIPISVGALPWITYCYPLVYYQVSSEVVSVDSEFLLRHRLHIDRKYTAGNQQGKWFLEILQRGCR